MLTVILALSGLRYPGPVLELAAVLARADMPVALLILGLHLKFTTARGRWADIGRVLGIRYAPGFAVGMALYALPSFDRTFRAGAFSSLLLPPTLIYPFNAVQFRYHDEFVGLLLNVSNVVSCFLLRGISNVLRLPFPRARTRR